LKFPYDELNMCDAEHVGWVKSQRGYFFLGVFGADHLRGQTDFPGEGLSGTQ
jgi:hypothetical protein